MLQRTLHEIDKAAKMNGSVIHLVLYRIKGVLWIILTFSVLVNVILPWISVIWSPVSIHDVPAPEIFQFWKSQSFIQQANAKYRMVVGSVSNRIGSGFGVAEETSVCYLMPDLPPIRDVDLAAFASRSLIRAGWPFRCMHGEIIFVRNETQPGGRLIRNTTLPNPLHSHEPFDQYQQFWRRLPVSPIWLGFAANVVCYALGLTAVVAVCLGIAFVRRSKRHLCMNCKYPLAPGMGCPECGRLRN